MLRFYISTVPLRTSDKIRKKEEEEVYISVQKHNKDAHFLTVQLEKAIFKNHEYV